MNGGFEFQLHGEVVHPDGGSRYGHETPLWRAVHLACACCPKSPNGLASRAIVRLLLSHSARPDRKGKIEYFIRWAESGDSDASMDPDGHRNTSDSETTPLEAATKRKLAALAPEWMALTAAPSWSSDVVDILRASVSGQGGTMISER